MRILITTGGSVYSYMAVKKACEMVIKPNLCEIRIISVFQDLAASSPEPLEITEEQKERIENIGALQSTDYALTAVRIIRESFTEQEVPVSTKVLRGSPIKVILEEAEKWKADVIVVGSLGHNFLSRMFLGSVSEAIVRHAKCTVLVVRGDVEQFQ